MLNPWSTGHRRGLRVIIHAVLPLAILFITVVGSFQLGFTQERTYCVDEGEHDCSDSYFAIRFESPDSGSYFTEIPNEPETTITAWVTFKHPDVDMVGWSFGVAHDPEVLDIVSIEYQELDLPSAFIAYGNIAVGDPAPGAAYGYITDFINRDAYLPPDREIAVAKIEYKLREGVEDTRTAIQFSDELLHIPAASPTLISVSPINRISEPFRVIDGILQIGSCEDCEPGVPFRRGEVNMDGNIDISDVLANVGQLFLGVGSPVDCDAMHDVNGDGSLDTSDPVTLLVWLFLGGKTPPPPFITCDAIGANDLECEVSNCN